ncbi:MAG: class I SAM-dependent methyltransferase [Alcanivorax sp.]|nr:class I SAM-dependent methyltransferase [Alcanivorax sp.]
MAVVWRAGRDGVEYEVRRHGRTLRLYANGVQHSEFHPTRLVTGSVWDLLWLPALLTTPESLRRVLVLGLGGGSLIPPLRKLVDPDLMVAVELDPLHLEVAETQFGVRAFGVETFCADAVKWAAAYQGPKFDLVIEDLFAPANKQVTRAVAADKRWLKQLDQLVSPTGILVMNFGEWREFSRSDAAKKPRGWANGYRLATPDCHNAVIVWTRQSTSSNALRRRVQAEPALADALSLEELRYTIRKLF